MPSRNSRREHVDADLLTEHRNVTLAAVPQELIREKDREISEARVAVADAEVSTLPRPSIAPLASPPRLQP